MDVRRVHFDLKHKGFSYAYVIDGYIRRRIGVCLKVKDATYHATWVFIPTRAFMAAMPSPYRGYCFGNNRSVAVANFLNGSHRVFQTGSIPCWKKSLLSAPSEEVQP